MPKNENGQLQLLYGESDNRVGKSAGRNQVNGKDDSMKEIKCELGAISASTIESVLSLKLTANNNKNNIMKNESESRSEKRKSEVVVPLGGDGEVRLPKRGRPRKNFVFPLVVSNVSQDLSTSAKLNHHHNHQGESGAGTVSVAEVNGVTGTHSSKVRPDNERTCQVCGKYYWKPSDLQRHLYKHTGERRFSCPICDQFFSCKRNMQYHQRAVHGLAIELSPGLDKKWKRRSYYFRAIEALRAAGGVQAIANGNEEGEHSTSGSVLSENEDHKISGNDGNLTETETDSSSCDQFVSVEDGDNADVGEFKVDTLSEETLISRSRGVNTSNGESSFVYKCHLCDKMYVSVEKIHEHFAEHFEALKPDDTYVCDICGELLRTKSDLKAHAQEHPFEHDDTNNYEPQTILSEEEEEECGSANSDGHDDMPSLLSPETLSDMAHASLALPVLEEGGESSGGMTVEMNDESWRPGGFKCKVCSKTFDRSFSLNRHLRSHTGVKKCNCPHCGRGFCEQRNLRHHIIRFHSDGSERHLLRRTRNRSRRSRWGTKAEEENGERNDTLEEQAALFMANEAPMQMLFPILMPNGGGGDSPEHQQEVSHGARPLDTLKTKVEKETNNENQECSNPGENNNCDVVDSVRKLLLQQLNEAEVKTENAENLENFYKNGLSSCMMESEKEDIVIKVEPPPAYSDEDEELEEDEELLEEMLEEGEMPSLASEPRLVIPGAPNLFSRKRGRRKKNAEDDDMSYIRPLDDVCCISPEMTDDSAANIKKGSHISKYTPRLPIIDKPERVKVIQPRRLQDGIIVFPCCYCDKVFTSTSDVHRHMNFHEDIRPYKCNQCHYYSRTTSQLKVHMMRHKGIKKYFCEPCNYYGVTQSDVNRHKKSQAHFARLAQLQEVGKVS